MILVVFLAGYLSENRALLADESTRIGPIRLPPLPYLAPMVAMLAIALGIVVVQRDLGAALLFFAVFLALLYVATGRPSYVVGGVLLFIVGSWVLYQLFGHVQTRVDNWLDPWRDPQGAGFQTIQALYAFGRGGILGVGLGNGLPTIGGRPPDPGDPHRLPARGAGRGARPHRAARDPRAVPRGHRARPPDRRRRPRRLPVAARGRPRAGHRGPGVHHRRGQPQAHPAHRDHAAVHLVRRLVAARERRRRRACCSRCPTAGPSRPPRPARRRAAGCRRLPAPAVPRRDRPPPARRRPRRAAPPAVDRRQRLPDRRRDRRARSRSSPLGAGYWQVVEAQRLSTAPDNPAVIAIARRALRGPIVDRDGRVARAQRARRERRGGPRVSRRHDQPRRRLRLAPVRDGRPRADVQRGAARAVGSGAFGRADGQVRHDARPGGSASRLSLDLRLQRAAVQGLGKDRGRGRHARPDDRRDPRAGVHARVRRARPSPTRTRRSATFEALLDDAGKPLLPRATLGRYVPGLGVQDRDRRSRGSTAGAIAPDDDLPAAAGGREDGPRRRRLPDPRRPPPA